MSEYFSLNTQRIIISQAIPGCFAVWPYFIIPFVQNHYIPSGEYFYGFVALFLILSLTVGYLFQNIGSRIELGLGKISTDEKEMDNYWEEYLRSNKKESEKIIMFSYIEGVVNRMKFELNMICAIPCMYIGIIILNRQYEITSCSCFLLYLFIVLFVLVVYLIYESYSSVVLLHKCRKIMFKK